MNDSLHDWRANEQHKHGRASNRLLGRLVFDCFNAKTDGHHVSCQYRNVAVSYREAVAGARLDVCQNCPFHEGG